MGEAFLRGMLRAKIALPSEIIVAEPIAERRQTLEEHGVRVTDDPKIACVGAELVLLAIKPEVLPALAESLVGTIPAKAVLVSIAAGVPLVEIQNYSKHTATVRVMPNLPAAIGEGACVYLAAKELSHEQLTRVEEVLLGVATAVVKVVDDEAVDLATALHGSGPAYVYLLIESMIESAVRLGMKRPEATKLVLATVAGAALYAIESGEHPSTLRNAVTSPGGTTAAALAELEASGLRTAIDNAIEAAFERALDLGESG
jgi:pyrroline-5-carboxylate reductase